MRRLSPVYPLYFCHIQDYGSDCLIDFSQVQGVLSSHTGIAEIIIGGRNFVSGESKKELEEALINTIYEKPKGI